MQSALTQPDAGAVPDQKLETGLSSVTEGVSAAVAGTATQGVLNMLGEPVDADAHVDGFDH